MVRRLSMAGELELQPAGPPVVIRVEARRSVSAVLVLFGLPEEMTSMILIHELFHVFLKLHPDFPDHLPPQVEEGMCQYVADCYLAWRQGHGTGEEVEYQQELAFLRHCVATDTDRVYGDGFRLAQKSVHKYGFARVMSYLKSHHGLPP